tara:strand:- start:346 stop:585 length:240 start_codon:yes stop_codon:yes gene_type:complete
MKTFKVFHGGGQVAIPPYTHIYTIMYILRAKEVYTRWRGNPSKSFKELQTHKALAGEIDKVGDDIYIVITRWAISILYT